VLILTEKADVFNMSSVVIEVEDARLLKRWCFFLMICGAAGGLSALDFSLSAGGGPFLGYTFTRYTLDGKSDSAGNRIEAVQTMDRLDFGGFVFFDAAYLEASVSLQGGVGGYKETMDFGGTSMSDDHGTGYEMMLGLSLLGKYPFTLNKKWSLFPMIGFECLIALDEKRQPDGDVVYDRTQGVLPEDRDKDGNAYPLSAWNSLLVRVGAGADYALTRYLFLRGELLYSFRLQTGYESGALDMVKETFKVSSVNYSGLTSGPTLKVALGYRFL
jgi:hypothetical protein